MQTQIPVYYRSSELRTEAISLLTAWVRHLKPFGRCPQLLLTARLASKAIDLANLLELTPNSGLASRVWEFHTRAYLLVMFADFYSNVEAVTKTFTKRNIALAPRHLRKVCERGAVRALISAKESDLRDDLYQSSVIHTCRLLEKRVHSRVLGPAAHSAVKGRERKRR